MQEVFEEGSVQPVFTDMILRTTVEDVDCSRYICSHPVAMLPILCPFCHPLEYVNEQVKEILYV